MPNYSKVQFISWELNTGPVAQNKIGYYPGINQVTDQRLDVLSQCLDIEARLKFTENAISLAHAKANADPGVLKVFMAPEFLYRGAGGAYLHDLLNGWGKAAPAEFGLAGSGFAGAWGGLFGGLQRIVANDDYKNWVFVFGTAISASFSTFKASDTKYYIDTSKAAEAYNTALIQVGGQGNVAVSYACRKHYISHIDFLDWNTSRISHISTSVLPADPESLIPADVLGVAEGGAVFTLANINGADGKPIQFGMEVCLDHACSGGNRSNHFGRLRTAGQYVKIQLVPSAGMSLLDASICLLPEVGPTPNSYAFNCDGLGNLNQTLGSHTQIWNGANGAVVSPANKLFEGSNGVPLANTQVSKVIATTSLGTMSVPDTVLWSLGSGNVRIINPLAL